ncbi:MAG: DUF2550 domain-containing protein [Propionibacteriaceae bacterium]
MIVLLLLLPLILLAVRRRWLAREGGTFECSLRLRTSTPGAGWALGVARYNAENLEWFRFFSYSYRPRRTFVRNEVNVLDNREPDAVEAVSLYAGQRIVRLQTTSVSSVHVSDLAMSQESLTGLLSWLEAAPPGVAGY